MQGLPGSVTALLAAIPCPAPAHKGVGDTAIRNYQKWQDIRVNMDTLCAKRTINTGAGAFWPSISSTRFLQAQ